MPLFTSQVWWRSSRFWSILIVFIMFFGAVFQNWSDSEGGGPDPGPAVSSSLIANSLLSSPSGQGEEGSPNSEKSFLQLAKESKTSKVTDVSYQCMYPETLGPYRHQKGLKILEIGLGCRMKYGPGASYKLWTTYFTEKPQIYFFEYDEPCAKKWLTKLERNFKALSLDRRQKLPIMTYGDQTNRTMLTEMAQTHGPWDFIIDDGCHISDCQITAFETLFEHVKPGGTYFIEDLYIWQIPRSNKTINMIAEVYAASVEKNKTLLGYELDHLSCCDAICALRKKKH